MAYRARMQMDAVGMARVVPAALRALPQSFGEYYATTDLSTARMTAVGFYDIIHAGHSKARPPAHERRQVAALGVLAQVWAMRTEEYALKFSDAPNEAVEGFLNNAWDTLIHHHDVPEITSLSGYGQRAAYGTGRALHEAFNIPRHSAHGSVMKETAVMFNKGVMQVRKPAPYEAMINAAHLIGGSVRRLGVHVGEIVDGTSRDTDMVKVAAYRFGGAERLLTDWTNVLGDIAGPSPRHTVATTVIEGNALSRKLTPKELTDWAEGVRDWTSGLFNRGAEALTGVEQQCIYGAMRRVIERRYDYEQKKNPLSPEQIIAALHTRQPF